MLYDLSSLWCDVGTTHNVAERSEFLEALYQRVFFVRLPAWTPLSVQNKVTRHLEGFEGSFEEVVVGGSPTKVPSKPGFGGTQSSATSPSAERPLRRCVFVCWVRRELGLNVTAKAMEWLGWVSTNPPLSDQ